MDVAGATAAKATSFFLPKKMASELTPNELKMEELRLDCERMRTQFEKNKDNIKKI